MKTFTRWLLALMLVATPILALVEWASANTELVPASRLVAPYWDVTANRSTLFLLTNASKSVDLLTVPTGAQAARGVHVEFYDKTCVRQDLVVDLSAGDVDQLDLKVLGTPALVSNVGWADIDVRLGDGQRDKDSIQCNVLLGVVVNADSAGDFAIAYPMASSIGSAQTGLLGTRACTDTLAGDTIVTHESNGGATSWAGVYEPFPSRVFVPFFFAEGGATLGMTSQLVIAAPTDGNWADTEVCAGAPAVCTRGESPGQNLPGLPGPAKQGYLMDGTALFWDGCENKESRSFGGHYITDALSVGTLLGPKAKQDWPWNTPGPSCKGNGPSFFPSVDDDYSGAFVGWVDLPNVLADSTGAGPRGMVGILIQNTTIGKKEGDVVRLWGDPADGGRNGAYSQVDNVTHNDLD
jgi:hypothetical protein